MRFWSRRTSSSTLLALTAAIPAAAEFVTKSAQSAGLVGVGTLAAALVGNYLLSEDQESLLAQTRTSFFLQKLCVPALKEVQKIDPGARMNIMKLERAASFDGMTRGRFKFHTQFDMTGQPDADLSLFGHQG